MADFPAFTFDSEAYLRLHPDVANFPMDAWEHYVKFGRAENRLLGPSEPIKPSSRSFTIGAYPTKTYKSLGGTIVKRSFGNRAINYTLTMQFNGVKQPVLETIFNHYHDQQGDTNGFSIPSSFFSDLNAAMSRRLQDVGSQYGRSTGLESSGGSGAVWFYADPPQVESGPIGLSNITVNLISEAPASIALFS